MNVKFSNWADAGPIIEREKIGLHWIWASSCWQATIIDGSKPQARRIEAYGLTALIAAGEVYELFKAQPPTP